MKEDYNELQQSIIIKHLFMVNREIREKHYELQELFEKHGILYNQENLLKITSLNVNHQYNYLEDDMYLSVKRTALNNFMNKYKKQATIIDKIKKLFKIKL